MQKEINFKRKKGGGGPDWGEGLDYLLKDCWEDLDKITEDNYYGKHSAELINFLFPKILEALNKSIIEMRNIFGHEQNQNGLNDWVRKAESIKSFGLSTGSLNDKVIFIDNATQFLRETSISNSHKQPSGNAGSKKLIESFADEIKGITAFKTSEKIQGIVKIILSKEDFLKMEENNILITDETDASFLMVMKKSKAIITDQGGILCHAAIVSRELKIPCIVGTKIATQVLKDGDLVEVDAEKGIVRKVEK